MKLFTTFLFFLCVIPNVHAISLEFKPSKIHGLYNFIGAPQGDPSRSARLKEIFQKSKFATSEAFAFLEKTKQLDENFLKWQGFFETQGILAKNLNDYDSRITGILPSEDQAKLISILKYFQPAYESLIWNQNEKKLKAAAKKFGSFANDTQAKKLISAIPGFYSTSTSHEKFIIGLLPIPGKKTNTYAKSLGGVASVEVAVDEKDDFGTFGVIVHELCHSFSSVSKFSQQYRTAHDAYAAPTYRVLEEGLATAIGNGLAYQIVAKKLDPSPWYNDKTINLFAHAVLPIIESYLSANKAMDVAFVQKSIHTFQNELSQQLYEYSSILNAMVLGSNLEGGRSIGREFRKQFTVTSIYWSSPIDTTEWKKTAEENWMTSQVFVLTPTDFKGLAMIEDLVPEAKGIAAKVASVSSPSVWEGLGQDKRPTLIFIVKNQEELAILLQKLKVKESLKNQGAMERIL